MEAFAYFPALIYRDERPDLAEAILGDCIQQLDIVREPNFTLYQSANLQHVPAFRQVGDYILTTAVTILREQGYDTSAYDFYLSGLWAQEVGRSTSTDVHTHRNSQMCGWMFLETPPMGAYPIYHDTRLNKSMVELNFVPSDEVTNATNSIHFNNVHPGSVLFANSWMRHQLAGGAAEQPTRCLHFIVSHKDKPCSTC